MFLQCYLRGAELEMRAAERATAKLLDENVDEAQRAKAKLTNLDRTRE